MKILIISNYFPPDVKGGYELRCKEASDFLYAKGEKVLVLTGNYVAEKQTSNSFNPGYRVVRDLIYLDYNNPSYWHKGRVEKVNYNICQKVIAEEKPDFVYFWNQAYLTLGPLWAVQEKNIPSVFDIGDIWPMKYLRKGLKDKAKSLIKRFLPNFIEQKMVLDNVFLVAEWLKPMFRDQVKSKNIYVIPRGVRVKGENEITKISPDNRMIFVGRLEPKKGLTELINVLAKITDLSWTLDVYGTGEKQYLTEVEDLIRKHHLQDRVILKGFLSPLDEAYRKHDIFLFPTLAMEPFGAVSIEAFSFGLPVFTIDRYGPGEVVQNGVTGFKCAADDYQCWEKSIRRLLIDYPLLKTMSKNALAIVEQKYEFEKIWQSKYEIIKKIYDEHRG